MEKSAHFELKNETKKTPQNKTTTPARTAVTNPKLYDVSLAGGWLGGWRVFGVILG